MSVHEQIAALSPQQIASLTQHQPEALRPQILESLSIAQVMALPRLQEAVVSADPVRSCGRLAGDGFGLPGVSELQVDALTVAQIQALTTH